MKEIYKPIKEYDNLYEISNLGNVKSLKYNKPRILKTGKFKNGYLYVNLCKNGKYKSLTIHRLVAKNFLGTSNLTVNHIDENKENNKLDNLEWLSSNNNSKKFKINNPFFNVGVNSPKSKLSVNDVKDIKYLLSIGKSQRKIAELFNVTKTCIGDIKRGVSYKNLL